MNCIIDNYSNYKDNESIYNEYVELRKLIIDWLIECNTEPEVHSKE